MSRLKEKAIWKQQKQNIQAFTLSNQLDTVNCQESSWEFKEGS